MNSKSLLASLAIFSLAIAHPAAAATRSFESLPDKGVETTAAADRVGSIDAEAESLRGSPLIVIVLVFGALAALLALSGSSGKSPG